MPASAVPENEPADAVALTRIDDLQLTVAAKTSAPKTVTDSVPTVIAAAPRSAARPRHVSWAPSKPPT
jgi:hypothetical protein